MPTTELKEEPALLHVFGPAFWHDTLRIIGNKDGLTALRDAIDVALKEGYHYGDSPATTSDGEYFDIQVLNYDKPRSAWNLVTLPYTDEIAADKREGIKHIDELRQSK